MCGVAVSVCVETAVGPMWRCQYVWSGGVSVGGDSSRTKVAVSVCVETAVGPRWRCQCVWSGGISVGGDSSRTKAAVSRRQAAGCAEVVVSAISHSALSQMRPPLPGSSYTGNRVCACVMRLRHFD